MYVSRSVARPMHRLSIPHTVLLFSRFSSVAHSPSPYTLARGLPVCLIAPPNRVLWRAFLALLGEFQFCADVHPEVHVLTSIRLLARRSSVFQAVLQHAIGPIASRVRAELPAFALSAQSRPDSVPVRVLRSVRASFTSCNASC